MTVIIYAKGKTYTFEENDNIGTGNFGEIFRGRDASNNPVAIKRISKYGDRKREKQTAAEIEIHRKAKHDRIIQFIASASAIDAHMIVLEFAPNGSLYDQILANEQQGISFTQPQLLKIRRDISAALLFLHQLLIIHGDVKDENVLLFIGPDGVSNYKLCDFGFSRQLTSPNDKIRDSFPGSPPYAAPELFNAHPYDCSVDMWALGILIYKCVMGNTPWDAFLILGTGFIADFISTMKQDMITNYLAPRFLLSSECQTVETLLWINPARRATSKEVFDQAEKELVETQLSKMTSQVSTLRISN